MILIYNDEINRLQLFEEINKMKEKFLNIEIE